MYKKESAALLFVMLAKAGLMIGMSKLTSIMVIKIAKVTAGKMAW